MFTFPFANMMGGIDPFDPFDNPLINNYNPNCPYSAVQELLPKEEVPKLEPPTSPGYLLPPPPSEPPQLALTGPQGVKTERVRKISKPSRDDDYKPYRRGNKLVKATVKQKEDRNLIPNTVHHLLAFVQKHFKSGYYTERIFAKLCPSPDYTVTRYYNFHRLLRGEVNHYVNQEAIRIIATPGIVVTEEYSREEQEFYCRLSRIVAKRFLKVDAVIMILRSKKVRRENIMEHLSVQRFLYENMTAVSTL